MKRVLAVAALATVASLLAVAPASADPVACVDLNVQINDQGQAQTVCLP